MREYLETHRNTPDLCAEMLRFTLMTLPRIRAMDPPIEPALRALENGVLFAELAAHPHIDVSDLAFRLLLLSCFTICGDGAGDLGCDEHTCPAAERLTLPASTIVAACHHACTRPSLPGLEFVQKVVDAQKCEKDGKVLSQTELENNGQLLNQAALTAIEEGDVELGSAILLALLPVDHVLGQMLLEGPMLRLITRAMDEREHLPRILRLIAHLRPWALDQIATDLVSLKSREEREPPTLQVSDDSHNLRHENVALKDALERKTRCLEQANSLLTTFTALQQERSSLHQTVTFTAQKLRDTEERLCQSESALERSRASITTTESLLGELSTSHQRAEENAMEQLRKLEVDNERLFALVQAETTARLAAEQRALQWEHARSLRSATDRGNAVDASDGKCARPIVDFAGGN